MRQCMYSVCLQSLVYCMNMATIYIIFCMWQKDKGDLFIKLVCLFSDVIFCQCLLCLKRRFSIWMLRFLYQYSALRSLHSITNHRCYSYFEHLWADLVTYMYFLGITKHIRKKSCLWSASYLSRNQRKHKQKQTDCQF